MTDEPPSPHPLVAGVLMYKSLFHRKAEFLDLINDKSR
jgi:hypothetical protein